MECPKRRPSSATGWANDDEYLQRVLPVVDREMRVEMRVERFVSNGCPVRRLLVDNEAADPRSVGQQVVRRVCLAGGGAVSAAVWSNEPNEHGRIGWILVEYR